MPGARNEYNALNPHCLNSIYASEGRNTLLKSLLFRVVGGGGGSNWQRLMGAGVGIHVFGGVKLAPMWPAQYWDCYWLPHVGCSVSFVIVFRFLLNFLYSQLLGELGSLVAPTWDAPNLCNCICILYLVLALNLCILCIWGRWAFLVAPTWDAQTLCEGSVLGSSLLHNGEYRIDIL